MEVPGDKEHSWCWFSPVLWRLRFCNASVCAHYEWIVSVSQAQCKFGGHVVVLSFCFQLSLQVEQIAFADVGELHCPNSQCHD